MSPAEVQRQGFKPGVPIGIGPALDKQRIDGSPCPGCSGKRDYDPHLAPAGNYRSYGRCRKCGELS